MNHRNRLKMKIRRQWERDCEQDITKNEWDTIGHVCNCPLKVTMVIFLCVCPAPGTVRAAPAWRHIIYVFLKGCGCR